MKTTERPQPYVGISGVSESRPHEIGSHLTQTWLLDQFIYAGLDDDTSPRSPYDRQPLFGVKATHKTQCLDVENKYGREWYPVGEEEFAIALEDRGRQQAAQIYMEPELVTDDDYRDEFVARICRRGKAWLNTLQFDMLPWHTDDTMLPFVERVKQETGHTIILQAHSESMRQLGPDRVVHLLGKYAHALNYVLFDASHGKGVRMEPRALMPFLGAGYETPELASVGFGVAGGLDAAAVREDLPELLAEYQDLSWDAEGKLHGYYPDGSCGLDWSAAKAYLEASGEVLRALPRETVY